MEWDREDRFKVSRPPRIFWWMLGAGLLVLAVVFLRMRTTDSHGGWIPALHRSIFYDAETASWWARAIPLVLIAILVVCGLGIRFFEHKRKRRIRI